MVSAFEKLRFEHLTRLSLGTTVRASCLQLSSYCCFLSSLPTGSNIYLGQEFLALPRYLVSVGRPLQFRLCRIFSEDIHAAD